MTIEQLSDLADCARATRHHRQYLERMYGKTIDVDVLLGMEITTSKIENIVEANLPTNADLLAWAVNREVVAL